MSLPTEAELFADLIEYRAMLDVLWAFNAGFIVNVERAHSGGSQSFVRYTVKIQKIGFWMVMSDQCETLRQAAEQARDRTVESIATESLVQQAQVVMNTIIAQQTKEDFYKVPTKGAVV